MDHADPPALTVRIAHGSHPIAGTVTHTDGSEQPFRGWIELTATLERARVAPPGTDRTAARREA